MKSTNTSANVGNRKFNSKYGVVRSSMFNKNPIFDRMDVEMMSHNNDNVSDYSMGRRSHLTRQLGGNNNAKFNDRYSSLGA